MRTSIHPEYHDHAKVICACGHTFTVGSTLPEIHVELCSACHPFYTGKQKILDSAGRVDKFKQRAAAKTTLSASRVGRRVKKERSAAKRKAKSESVGAEK